MIVMNLIIRDIKVEDWQLLQVDVTNPILTYRIYYVILCQCFTPLCVYSFDTTSNNLFSYK